MTITFDNGFFVAHSIFDENEKLKRGGFKWDTVKKKWMSNDFRCAENLISYCDSLAVFQIRFIKENLQKAVQKSASAEGVGNIKLYHQPNMKPYPYQQAGVEYMLPRPAVILADSMGLGKLEFIDNKVFTPKGRKRIGDLKIGDKVIGSDGKSHNIVGVFPQGEKDLYRVTFNDGCSVLVGLEHLWTVFTRQVNTSRKIGQRDRTVVLTTGQLLDKNLKLKIKGIGWNEKRPYEFSTYYIEKSGNFLLSYYGHLLYSNLDKRSFPTKGMRWNINYSLYTDDFIKYKDMNAISVLSAVEGLKIATPFFNPYIIPLTVLILVSLFYTSLHKQ